MKKTINLKTRTASCKIHIGQGLTQAIPEFIKKMNPGNYCFLITQEKILSAHKRYLGPFLRAFPYTIITVPDGEKAKSKKWLFYILDRIMEKDSLKRLPFIACLGGGVVGDLGGFSAAVYKRGLPLIQIPTTLLAQVDAAIGGKTAIDLKQAKNMIGTYYQPRAVFIDPYFLNTLPDRELLQGLAEIIKYAAIKDKNLFELLSVSRQKIMELETKTISEVIERCVRIKAGIVSRDETETRGLRTILNFGHTIGHALETSAAYSRRISHGEAVGLGMISAGMLSFNLGLGTAGEIKALHRLIKDYGLPVKFSFDLKLVLNSLMHDKKFISGSIRMVLLEHIGKAVLRDKIPLKSIRNSLKYISA